MEITTGNKIKVIFLDVDGVLNSSKTTRRTTGGYTFVGSRQLKNLRRIITKTGDTTKTIHDTTAIT